MSPERFENKPYSFKSDVWALGCILYEMISLRHAFDAKEMSGLMFKVVKGASPPIPPHFNPALGELVKAVLQKLPAKRPSVSQILKMPFIKKYVEALSKQNPEHPLTLEDNAVQSKKSSSKDSSEAEKENKNKNEVAKQKDKTTLDKGDQLKKERGGRREELKNCKQQRQKDRVSQVKDVARSSDKRRLSSDQKVRIKQRQQVASTKHKARQQTPLTPRKEAQAAERIEAPEPAPSPEEAQEKGEGAELSDMESPKRTPRDEIQEATPIRGTPSKASESFVAEEEEETDPFYIHSEETEDESSADHDEILNHYQSQVNPQGEDGNDEGEEDEEEVFVPMHGSLSSRITSIQEYCKKGLGNELFNRVYKLLKEKPFGDDSQNQQLQERCLKQWLGEARMYEFSSLISQLIFCEEALL
jgi:hypothetical protein